MLYYNQDKGKGKLKMKDSEIIEMLEKYEEEGIIVSFDYYEEEEFKFFVKINWSKLSKKQADKLNELLTFFDKQDIVYYEECE